jgi:hypothetical protein
MFAQGKKRKSSVSPSRLRLSSKRECRDDNNPTEASSIEYTASKDATVHRTMHARTANPEEHLPPPQRSMRVTTVEEAKAHQKLRDEDAIREHALL